MEKRDREMPYEVVIQERKRVDLYGNVVYYIYWFDKYGNDITNEWTNKDGNEKYSTKNLPKAHFRWDWRRYTLSKESVDKITEFVDTILES